MKICRFDNDRLGVIVDGMVRDVTAAQNEIRAAHPYDAKSDAIIAALPEWRSRLEDMAEDAAPITLESVNLLPPIARPGKLMAAPVGTRLSTKRRPTPALGTSNAPPRSGRLVSSEINTALIGAAAGPFGSRTAAAITSSNSSSSSARSTASSRRMLRRDRFTLGLDMTARPEIPARKAAMGMVLGPWFVTADEIADPDDVSTAARSTATSSRMPKKDQVPASVN